MSHITEIVLQNYRSFRTARCRLSPFTLIVGANNAGKSNLLKAVQQASMNDQLSDGRESLWKCRHQQCEDDSGPYYRLIWNDGGVTTDSASLNNDRGDRMKRRIEAAKTSSDVSFPEIAYVNFDAPLEIYRLDPNIIGKADIKGGEPYIAPDGEGVSWMLDKWNSGSRAMRARFDQVETALQRCVPEILKLSFYDEDVGKRAIQVEQTGLPEPRPLNEVSDGTRLVLAILTLVNQETPPPVLLLEDIDRGLHPRLYEQLVVFLRSLAAQGRTQILATTHDPYLMDEFRDTPEAVVIVDKKDGASTLSNLDERLNAIRAPGEELEMPLGQVWFSGLVGGVPKMKLPEILRVAEE